MFISHEGTSSCAKSFLDWDYVHSMSASGYWKNLQSFGFPGIRSHQFELLLNYLTKAPSSPQITSKVGFRVPTWNFAHIILSLTLVHCESFSLFSCFCRQMRIFKNSIVWKSKFCVYIPISLQKQLEKLKLSQRTSHMMNITYAKFQAVSFQRYLWGTMEFAWKMQQNIYRSEILRLKEAK